MKRYIAVHQILPPVGCHVANATGHLPLGVASLRLVGGFTPRDIRRSPESIWQTVKNAAFRFWLPTLCESTLPDTPAGKLWFAAKIYS